LDAGDPAVLAINIGCTGTLISPRVVVTAAHCLNGYDPTSVRVDNGSGQVINGVDLVLHPDWSSTTEQPDIALLLLETPIAYGMASVLRAPMDDSLLGATVRIVGFGVSNPMDQTTAGIKRQGTTTLGAYLFSAFVDDAAPSSTCFGDSGGPAFIT